MSTAPEAVRGVTVAAKRPVSDGGPEASVTGDLSSTRRSSEPGAQRKLQDAGVAATARDVGGGDAAFENALILAETASEVTLVHRQKRFRARAEFVEQVINNPKVKILTDTTVREIVGRERIEAVELENLCMKQRFVLAVEVILIRVGVEPNTEILRGKLELDEQGYVKINQNCETSIKGIYAVGDVANPIAPTVSSAVGMGATAVKTIFAKC